MDISYVITPLLAWLGTGIIKFIINTLQHKQLAFNFIGYGGMPSNHSAIVSSCFFFVAYKDGIESSAFIVALTLAFIVILDASSLRKHIEKQSKVLNQVTLKMRNRVPLREKIGHSKFEIMVGVLCGFITSSLVVKFNHFFII